MRTHVTHRLLTLLLSLTAAAMLGCPSDDPHAGHDHSDHDHAAHDHAAHADAGGANATDATTSGGDIYTVRGEVVSLPDPADPTSEFKLHHEAIPNFKDATGAVTGMSAMTMPFPPADPALLDGLAIGDKVEATFDVDWDRRPQVRMTRIERIVADADLVVD